MKKLFSLLLTVIIIMTTIPCALVSAEDPELTDEQKIEIIKEAWQNLEIPVKETIPNRASGDMTIAIKNAVDTSILPDGAKVLPAIIGSSYIKATLPDASTDEPIIANSDGKAEYGTHWVLYNSFTDTDISKLNVKLSFYVESLNEGEMSLTSFFRKNGGDGALTGAKYEITAEDVGKWITLTSKELKGENYNSVTDLGNSGVIGIYSTVPNSIYLGSLIFTQNIAFPDGSDNWMLDQWIVAAKELDTTGYDNVSEFNEAVASVETNTANRLFAIRKAYTNIEQKVIEIRKSTAGDCANKNFKKYILPDRSMLPAGAKGIPTYMTEYTPVNIPANSSGGTPTTVSDCWVRFLGASNYEFGKYNIYFSFYLDELNGTMSIAPDYRDSSGGQNTGKIYEIKPDDVGKWITLSSKDLKGVNFDKVTRLMDIIFSINSTEANTIYLGTYLFTENISLPEGCDYWNLTDWISYARETDLTGYYNYEQFMDVINSCDKNPEFVSAMYNAKTTRYMRHPHQISLNGEPGILAGVTISDKENHLDGIDYRLLGGEYCTYEFTGEKTLLLFQNGDQNMKLENIDGMELWYKVENDDRADKTATISVPVTYRKNYNTDGFTEIAFELDVSKSGWQCITVEDLLGEGGLENLFTYDGTGATPLVRAEFDLTSAKGLTLTFGSILFMDTANMPVNYTNFSERAWLKTFFELANDPRYSNLHDLKAVCQKFEEGITYGKLKNISGVSDDELSIMDLIVLKKNSTDPNWYYIEADLTKDAKIDASDMVVLKRLILGDASVVKPAGWQIE